MQRSITFDVERLIGALNVIEGTQIRYAGTQAMKRLGYELQQATRAEMPRIFDKPVPRTMSSVRYDAQGLNLRMHILGDNVAKGQDAGRYLYPVSTDDTQGTKPAYITRFTRALRRRQYIDDSLFAVPWKKGYGVPENEYGNVPAGYYGSVLAGLARRSTPGGSRTIQAGWRIFSLPDKSPGAVAPKGAALTLPPGIYRAKGRELQFLFGYANRVPTVTTIFDWRGSLTRRAEPLLSRLLRQELDKAVR